MNGLGEKWNANANGKIKVNAQNRCPRCQAELVVRRVADHLFVCETCGEPVRSGLTAPSISAKAQISMMLGILSLVFSILTALPAMILGWSALHDIRRHPDRLHGRELAAGGISLGLIVTLFNVGCTAWMFRAPIAQQVAQRNTDTVVPAGSEWRWLHPVDGLDPAIDDEDFHTTFHELHFDDSAWMVDFDQRGVRGGFGYGDDIAVDIGTPPEEERRTAYFRHRFSTDKEYDGLFVRLRRDDGVIIYLDGVEVARDNVHVGQNSFELLALQTASGDQETSLRSIYLNGNLPTGEHVLAVSLHNRGTTSSDLRLGEISLHGRPLED